MSSLELGPGGNTNHSQLPAGFANSISKVCVGNGAPLSPCGVTKSTGFPRRRRNYLGRRVCENTSHTPDDRSSHSSSLVGTFTNKTFLVCDLFSSVGLVTSRQRIAASKRQVS